MRTSWMAMVAVVVVATAVAAVGWVGGQGVLPLEVLVDNKMPLQATVTLRDRWGQTRSGPVGANNDAFLTFASPADFQRHMPLVIEFEAQHFPFQPGEYVSGQFFANDDIAPDRRGPGRRAQLTRLRWTLGCKGLRFQAEFDGEVLARPGVMGRWQHFGHISRDPC